MSEADTVKQVIVMRKDLNMRKGKMCAQAAHASIAFLTRRIGRPADGGSGDWCPYTSLETFSDAELVWLRGLFTKICVSVDSEAEFWEIVTAADRAGVAHYEIKDAGLTEFKEPTWTCVALGPDYSSKIDPITRHLKLL